MNVIDTIRSRSSILDDAGFYSQAIYLRRAADRVEELLAAVDLLLLTDAFPSAEDANAGAWLRVSAAAKACDSVSMDG